MYIPQTFAAALLMMVISTICWGSWANTFKGTRGYRFELFYWDYIFGVLGMALAFALTLGSMHADGSDFLSNIRSADAGNVISALIAGIIFNVANVLLVAGIDMAGLAIAFPVAIGAVIFDGHAYRQLGRSQTPASRKSIAVCVVSGVLMGLFAPFVGRALNTGHALSAYSIGVCFTLGALLCCLVVNVYLMRKPLVGPPVNWRDYFSAGLRNHGLGLLGGGIWGLGMVFNFVAASLTGVAISYAIGQAAPMVAAAWGIFVWREFNGANRSARISLALMFVLFIAAIVLVSFAYGVSN